MSDTAKYLHALNIALGGEPQKLFKVLEQYGNPETAWQALKTAEGDLDAEAEKLKREGVRTIADDDPAYPELLGQIYQPPKLLYIRGALPEMAWVIAIVGTRKPTEYGRTVAQLFGEALAQAGAIIVSGLAYGIDRETHVGTLRGSGRAVAVIGSGLDRASFYPQANWPLAEEIIAKGGAIISEYPPGKKAFQSHFPERNRVIAGLSHGVLLVEATDRSGTQITARLAMEENRDVFAVPGSIFSETSKGPNRLLKEGAIPALSPDDILEFYGKTRQKSPASSEELTELELKILDFLYEPTLFDDLMVKSGEAVHELQAVLSLLELKGKIRELEPGRYQALAMD